MKEKLNRRQFPVSNQPYYNNWSPPAPSNETSNGYYIERSASARLTLDRALELYPDEVRSREAPLAACISNLQVTWKGE